MSQYKNQRNNSIFIFKNNFKKNYLKILEIGEKLSANNSAAGP